MELLMLKLELLVLKLLMFNWMNIINDGLFLIRLFLVNLLLWR